MLMPVQVVLDKLRTLHFDILATRDLEDELNGRPLGAIVSDMGRYSITAITLALYVGLKHEDPTLTKKLVTKLMEAYLKEGRYMSDLVKLLTEALEETGLFRTKDDEDSEGNAKPEAVAAT